MHVSWTEYDRCHFFLYVRTPILRIYKAASKTTSASVGQWPRQISKWEQSMTQDRIAAQQPEIYLARHFIEHSMCMAANRSDWWSPLQGAASLGGETEDERVPAGFRFIKVAIGKGPRRSSAGGDRRLGRRVALGSDWVMQVALSVRALRASWAVGFCNQQPSARPLLLRWGSPPLPSSRTRV